MADSQQFDDALRRAEHHAPYLRMLMKCLPETTNLLARNCLIDALTIKIDSTQPVKTALRVAKRQLALSLAIGDLAQVLTLEEVVERLTAFADMALTHAIDAAFDAVVPGAPHTGFAVIALGKHGSRELNYSSDIDPVLIFDPNSLPCRRGDEPVETAVQIARKVVEIMQERDGDGYVFRVDLRLRPSPEATPLALPLNAAISYYESSALPWERAAYIRARACAGDIALGQHFLDAIKPFIWRRSLDFGVVQEIKAISYRIRDHFEEGQEFGPGFDLKRGSGGIRDCEFFAQINQLIHGGRNPALRSGATVPALTSLAEAGWVAPDEAKSLISAYHLYRTIEHRLQMVDDQQTHALPKESAALDNVARLHGLKKGRDLLGLLEPHVKAVRRIYAPLDAQRSSSLPFAIDQLQEALHDINLSHYKDIAKRITTWRSGKYRALRSPNAQAVMEETLPALVAAFAQAPDPLTAVNRFDQLVERLPSAINLFYLLHAQPQLLDLLVKVLSYAPLLADELARRADLLDGLIDASALDPLPDIGALERRIQNDDPNADLELKLDRIRRTVAELRFALGVQIITGVSDPLDAAAGYARVAEAAVNVATDATIVEYERTHGSVAQSELVILALGRFGGGELTHASDLDLIFLFTGDYRGISNASNPIGAVQYFNRLAQRTISSLSVPTAAGPLYQIDTRLRPSGAKGELCVSLEGFIKYQRKEAWTWEHMALTRARVIYGSDAARKEVQSAIDAILSTRRQPEKVIRDAIEMRTMIATHKPPMGPLDIKLGKGGLVDLEFCVHVRQLLAGCSSEPNIMLALAQPDMPKGFHEAYRLMTRLLVILRLVAPDLNLPPKATKVLIANVCDKASWLVLMRELDGAQKCVATEWKRLTAST